MSALFSATLRGRMVTVEAALGYDRNGGADAHNAEDKSPFAEREVGWGHWENSTESVIYVLKARPA